MMSMITPPIALAAFAAASIAKAPTMQTGFAAVKFGWSAYIIPILFVFSPTLLLIGTPLEILLTIITAVLGVWLVSAALAGYFSGHLSMPSRLLFALFGLMALVPAQAFEGAVYSDIVGVAGALVMIGIELLRRRAAPQGAES
jgi:TRAP-type uncharacterized transport system fused permease subunit